MHLHGREGDDANGQSHIAQRGGAVFPSQVGAGKMGARRSSGLDIHQIESLVRSLTLTERSFLYRHNPASRIRDSSSLRSRARPPGIWTWSEGRELGAGAGSPQSCRPAMSRRCRHRHAHVVPPTLDRAMAVARQRVCCSLKRRPGREHICRHFGPSHPACAARHGHAEHQERGRT